MKILWLFDAPHFMSAHWFVWNGLEQEWNPVVNGGILQNLQRIVVLLTLPTLIFVGFLSDISVDTW